MKKDIKNRNNFLDKMKKLDCCTDKDVTEYIRSLREKSRIIVGKFCLKQKV